MSLIWQVCDLPSLSGWLMNTIWAPPPLFWGELAKLPSFLCLLSHSELIHSLNKLPFEHLPACLIFLLEIKFGLIAFDLGLIVFIKRGPLDPWWKFFKMNHWDRQKEDRWSEKLPWVFATKHSQTTPHKRKIQWKMYKAAAYRNPKSSLYFM